MNICKIHNELFKFLSITCYGANAHVKRKRISLLDFIIVDGLILISFPLVIVLCICCRIIKIMSDIEVYDN